MKTKKYFLILACIFLKVSLYSQNSCQFQGVFQNPYSSYELGGRIIQSGSDGSFLTTSAIVRDNIRYLFISKIGACGNLIWRSVLDSTTLSFGSPNPPLNLWEDADGNILCAGGYSTYRGGLRLFKLDQQGNIKLKRNIGDSKKDYGVFSVTRMNDNRFLYSGTYLNSNFISFCLMTDTMGNILWTDTFLFQAHPNVFNGLINTFKLSDGKIICLDLEDSILRILCLDSSGNALSISQVSKKFGNSINQKLPYTALNHDKSELLLAIAPLSFSSSAYLSRLRLDGTIIQETNSNDAHLTPDNFNGVYIQYCAIAPLTALPDKKLLLNIGWPLVILDSNFKVIWSDSSAKNDWPTWGISESILTKDGVIASVGTKYLYRSITDLNDALYLRIIPLNILVHSISIAGYSSINTKGGSAQLSAALSPTNAQNQTLVWSINDTSKATLNQIGTTKYIVTAKANGIVVVTATATDGSGISASKTITITNQTIGVNELQYAMGEVQVFPNPASSTVTVQAANATIKELHIFNLSGTSIKDCVLVQNVDGSVTTDISGLSQGFYMLQVVIEKGSCMNKMLVQTE